MKTEEFYKNIFYKNREEMRDAACRVCYSIENGPLDSSTNTRIYNGTQRIVSLEVLKVWTDIRREFKKNRLILLNRWTNLSSLSENHE